MSDLKDFVNSLPGEDMEVKEESQTSQPQDEKDEETKEENIIELKEETKTSDESSLTDQPFHEHPRFRELIQEKNQLKESLSEMQDKIEKLQSNNSSQENITIPEWFTELYGQNEYAYKKLLDHETSTRDTIKKEIVQEYKQQVEQQQAEVSKWDKWLSDGLSTLKSDGKKFNETELLNVIKTYSPSDNNGNIDLNKAYDLYTALNKNSFNKEKSDAKKNLAASTSSEGENDNSIKDFKTSKDVRYRGWGDLTI